MPCIKCSNKKWKYGAMGKCVYKTLAKCKSAAAAIHAKVIKPNKMTIIIIYITDPNKKHKLDFNSLAEANNFIAINIALIKYYEIWYEND